MKARIINIGDEVLSGRVLNTNGPHLSRELEKAGIQTEKIIVIGDSEYALVSEIRRFLADDVDLLVTTGGLGPTADDITKQAIARALGLDMRLHEAVKKSHDDRFCFYNENLAYFPSGADIIENDGGSADGLIIHRENKTIMSLVGPPLEIRPMFKKAIPFIAKHARPAHAVSEYTLSGKDESAFEEDLRSLREKFPAVTIRPYTFIGKIMYILKADQSESAVFSEVDKQFQTLMQHYIIGSGDVLLEEAVYEVLKEKGYRISFAESCTGGLLAAMVVSVPGASDVMGESLVVYSNEAKIKYLGVKSSSLHEFGAVSAEVAGEMACGLADLTGSDVNISVSGIAGPGGGSAEKPVGLVYYAIKIKEHIYIEHRVFSGDRNLIRNRAAMWIFYRLWALLKC